MVLAVERGFALAAATLLVVAAALVVAPGPASAGDGASGGIAYEASVPDEYDFERPVTPGRATVDGRSFDSLQAALDAAEPGDTVRLAGRFEERVTVETDGLTLRSEPGSLAVVDGGGHGDVLTVDADDVTLRRVWVRNSGFETSTNDAGVWIDGTNVTVVDSRVSAVTFGIWVDGVPGTRIENTTIVGRESVRPLSYRGNGIQLWKTERSVVEGNRITDVRDGIYYSWASAVRASGNTMWDLRYGVHYMYSDDCTLEDNVAFGNDAGYALMVSQRLVIRNNTAVGNRGTSGHGILLKSVDRTTVANNTVLDNGNGLYVYNSLDNRIVGNLVLANDVGVYLAAGSVRETVEANSFIRNERPVLAVVGEQVAWNGSDRGNYWSGARRSDVDHDGINEVRYRPAGLVEHLQSTHPQAVAFAASPAFDAIRRAESAFPVIESPGVIDHHPLADPPAAHRHWKRYYERDRDD